MICHPIIISHFVLAKQQCLSSILSHFVAMFSSPMLDFCEKLVRHNLISFSAPKAMYARKMLIWFFPLLGFLLSQWDNRHTIVAQRLICTGEIWCSRLHPLRERECGIDERMYIHARRALIVCQQVNVGGGGGWLWEVVPRGKPLSANALCLSFSALVKWARLYRRAGCWPAGNLTVGTVLWERERVMVTLKLIW